MIESCLEKLLAGHGIYRFRQIPTTELAPYMLATLWASGRGVLSHDTALELHQLCDINPDKIHLTLPPNYRPRRQEGERYVVHYQRLDETQVGWHEGIRTVTPETAIRQALATGVPTHLIRDAIDTADRFGLVNRQILNELGDQMRTRT